jgi:hypothetical protein
MSLESTYNDDDIFKLIKNTAKPPPTRGFSNTNLIIRLKINVIHYLLKAENAITRCLSVCHAVQETNTTAIEKARDGLVFAYVFRNKFSVLHSEYVAVSTFI